MVYWLTNGLGIDKTGYSGDWAIFIKNALASVKQEFVILNAQSERGSMQLHKFKQGDMC